MITEEQINEIKKKSDIVEVISSYIPLTKKGRNYFGLCPFHDDHSPSMSVSPEKGIFNCFVCGAKGNAISFVMDYEKVNYVEALKVLADKCGISLNVNTYKKKDNYDELYKIYDTTCKFYQNNLNTSSGKEAREYLKNRGISEDIIKEFNIGLALSFDKSVTKLLIKKGYKENTLVDIGISNKTDYGYQDLFLNRVMFPLWNIEGKIVGYSGRIYNTTDSAKYINTKETVIFKKGLNLYNYHRAKNEVRLANQVIIMEGFMDVIRAYSVGIKNVIATMGTALTKEQASLIKKLSNNVILCFDGDAAGNKATSACGNELIKIGINPKVVRLESNLDPDEYIIKYGVKKFKDKLNNCISFLDFRLNYLKEGKNLNDNEDLSNYINAVIDEVITIDDEILRELTLKKISSEINISFETLINKMWKKLEENNTSNNMDIPMENMEYYPPPPAYEYRPNEYKTNKKISKNVINDTNIVDKYTKAERKILFYMLHDKELTYKYEKVFPYLPTKIYRFLASEIMYFVKKYDTISISDFLNYLSSKQELVDLVGKILNYDYDENYTEEEITDYFKVLREYNFKSETERLTELLKNESDLEKQIELANKIMNLKKGVEESARD